MDLLYVVELDVTAASGQTPDPGDLFTLLRAHAVSWLGHDVQDPSALGVLEGAGEADLLTERMGRSYIRHVAWSTQGTEHVQSLRCVVKQELDDAPGAFFVCEVTIFHDEKAAAIRIEMGRETAGGLLTPASVRFLRRPGFLQRVLSDRSLKCTYQGQTVDGRFQWINRPQAAIVPEVVKHPQRLPLLLVDGRTQTAIDLGREASRQLAGLVQVALLDAPALLAVNGRLADMDAAVPYGGARLVWPSLGTRNPDFTEEQVALKTRTIDVLLKLLTPLSVAARGQNRYARRAAEAARIAREATFAETLASARAAGDAATETAALRQRVDDLNQDVAFWEAEAERLQNEIIPLRNAVSEAQYWREEFLRTQAAQSAPGGSSWQNAPDIDGDDCSALCEFLTKISAGAIVFTANAVRSWKQSGYPHADAMQQALVTLGQAAAEWRQKDCQIGMMIDDWFKTRWSMNSARTDKGLVNEKGDWFLFEGKRYSREPHLKLDDHTSPNQVGRVYFALDTENKRFIVDHVGLKLYGL